MRRSGISVASNIVEGCARSTETEYLRFLDIAYGSIRELEYQIELSEDRGYLGSSDGHDFGNLCPQTAKQLCNLIIALRRHTH